MENRNIVKKVAKNDQTSLADNSSATDINALKLDCEA